MSWPGFAVVWPPTARLELEADRRCSTCPPASTAEGMLMLLLLLRMMLDEF